MFSSILPTAWTWLQVIFHLFTHLEQFLVGMRMGSDEEVKKTIKDWFSGLVANFYDVGLQKLITLYGKSLNLHGDYVGK
jgi:hypothetical protein